jgi:cysteine desulfurase
MIYLDHNATTPIAPEVVDAMAPFLTDRFGNPSSSHAFGRAAKDALEGARGRVARLLGCQPEEIVFSSGGTESNNMVIKGVAHTLAGKGRHIITTSIEHPSVMNPCLFLMYQGYDITFLPVDGTGWVDPEAVRHAIRPATVLISVMHANNETGTIQAVNEIGHIARNAGVLFHTDAAQSVGKIATEVSALNVDFMSLAGHKVYAPKGVGVLFVRDGVKIEPLLHGAGQEAARRAGTENVMFAVGLGTACNLALETMPQEGLRLCRLRDRLHELLLAAIPDLTLNGHPSQRLPNTLNVSFRGVDGSKLLETVPDLAASTGAACHDRSVTLSHVLAAMGVSKEIGRGAVRLTLGRATTQSEIEKTADLLIAAYRTICRPL